MADNKRPCAGPQQAPDRTRRRLIAGAGTAAAVIAAPAIAAPLRRGFGDDAGEANELFTLGVASGDPWARSFMIWTRLAPDPLNGGGMGARPVPVRWRVASDPAMNHVVRQGVALAHPRNGHAVTAGVHGLEPDRWYYYQFEHRGKLSRIGRGRTFPARGQLPQQMRFALASCQRYETGFYAAYRDMATQPLDFVVHVGDYMYENGASADVPPERRHAGGETIAVEDYRNRYAQHRLDPDLQDAHAAFPFIVTWDDHEVDNNYAALVPDDDQDAAAFFERRRNAYQVYEETMPLRRFVRERRGSMNLFRRLRFGELAELLVLDSRQFRSDQVCGDGLVSLQQCPEILDADNTMLGERQEAWLFRHLQRSRAVWNVMAQQVMMMQWDLGVLAGAGANLFNVDAWDGYRVARNRIMRFLRDERIANPVVLTGDIHSFWASNLKADFEDAGSEIVGAEFVCSGITSSFGDDNDPLVRATLGANPHIEFFDGLHRGYALCEVNPSHWVTTFRAVNRVADPVFTVPSADIASFDLAAYSLNSGQPGLNKVL